MVCCRISGIHFVIFQCCLSLLYTLTALYVLLSQGADLFDVVLHCQHFCEADVICAMKQLSMALVYLHAHKIAHRDIKLENIFVSIVRTQMYTYIQLRVHFVYNEMVSRIIGHFTCKSV